MATILVPGPPKESFNKDRRISDLLLSQVKHFQHVEAKLDPSLRTNFSSRILTENAAAQYIAQMTDLLRGRTPHKVATAAPILVPPRAKAAAKPVRRTKGIDLAAKATAPASDSKHDSAPKKKTATNKRKSTRQTGKKP
jgi:hypothetical protein